MSAKVYHQYSRHLVGALVLDKIDFYRRYPEKVHNRFRHLDASWGIDRLSSTMESVLGCTTGEPTVAEAGVHKLYIVNIHNALTIEAEKGLPHQKIEQVEGAILRFMGKGEYLTL
ncbi:hypothetical protein M0804_015314 [Polistes exclamans]|nr:hypothetical protein M0804_015314 [Polistes exclamans]